MITLSGDLVGIEMIISFLPISCRFYVCVVLYVLLRFLLISNVFMWGSSSSSWNLCCLVFLCSNVLLAYFIHIFLKVCLLFLFKLSRFDCWLLIVCVIVCWCFLSGLSFLSMSLISVVGTWVFLSCLDVSVSSLVSSFSWDCYLGSLLVSHVPSFFD